jgi:hypothetical protein
VEIGMMTTNRSIATAPSREDRLSSLQIQSDITPTPCDSRFISRCAVALADAYYSRCYSPDEWVITHNIAVSVLTEQHAEVLGGETPSFLSNCLTAFAIAVMLGIFVWVWRVL